MNIKIIGPRDAFVIDVEVNEYLATIKDENLVDIQMHIDAEGACYVMVVTK